MCSNMCPPASHNTSMPATAWQQPLKLMVQENYTEEPIAELEEVPAEEPAKADGGEED